ncbi:hypothetical protein FDECE_2873 [Fusarium decemcellulare]|nr:hypothetical protein FDECE_2873 [Fusarium decemcellulare]
MVRLIISFDGTANSEYIEGNPLTNISRLMRYIAQRSADGLTQQLVYYQSGIGTSFRNPLNLWQQGFGNEIKRVIIQAYTFIVDNYSNASDDQIFLVGFSRGAFAARCLGDLIDFHGVLPKGKRSNIHKLYQYWSKTHNRSAPDDLRGPKAEITACALWDTVGAIGVPVPGALLRQGLPFITSDIPGSIKNIFQALALHEHRYHFFPIVLHVPANSQYPRLEQCWFAGYHADAGGGNKNDALAHFALVWIMSKLREWINFDMGFNVESLTDEATGNDNNDGWESLIPYTSWTISDSVGAYRHHDGSCAYHIKLCVILSNEMFPVIDRLRVLDSMTKYFKAGLSKYRIPQTEFWCDEGCYAIPANQDQPQANRSWETMHSSTRYLLQTGLVGPFHATERIEPDQPQYNNDRWSWSLRCTTESWLWRRRSRGDQWSRRIGWQVEDGQGGNNIPEAELDNFQKRTLRHWAWIGHRQLDDGDHEAGDAPPGTILVHLRAWLGEHGNAAVPVTWGDDQ